jgi:hypothetical protein
MMEGRWAIRLVAKNLPSVRFHFGAMVAAKTGISGPYGLIWSELCEGGTTCEWSNRPSIPELDSAINFLAYLVAWSEFNTEAILSSHLP